MKAIILAAGLSSRLHPRTLEIPKCLLPLHGRTIMGHQLDMLESHGVTDVTVIVGFLGEAIRQEIGGRVTYTEFPDFADTNNLHTLNHCRHLLDDDCVILFADVLMEKAAMGRLVNAPEDFALFVDTTRVLEGTMRVLIEDGAILDIGGHIPAALGQGNFIGIAKFSRAGAALLSEELNVMAAEQGHEQEYYVQTLPRLARQGQTVTPVEIGARWLEIDTGAEYEDALTLDFYV